MDEFRNDAEFEKYLRTFRPITPAVPPFLKRRTVLRTRLSFAAAAVVLLALFLNLLHRHSAQPVRNGADAMPRATDIHQVVATPLTIAALSRATQYEENKLGAALDAASAQSLPRTDHPHSALNTLAADANSR